MFLVVIFSLILDNYNDLGAVHGTDFDYVFSLFH